MRWCCVFLMLALLPARATLAQEPAENAPRAAAAKPGAKKRPANPLANRPHLPRARIDEAELLLLDDDGAIAGSLRGRKGATNPDGSVELTDAAVVFYARGRGAEADKLVPQVSGSAGRLLWTEGTRRVECRDGLAIVLYETKDDGEVGERATISAASADLTFDLDANGRSRLSARNLRDTRMHGFGMQALAPEIEIDIELEREPEAGRTGLDRIASLELRSPKGVEVILPSAFDLNSTAAGAGEGPSAYCRGMASLSVVREAPDGERAPSAGNDIEMVLTLDEAAHIGDPAQAWPLLAADRIELRAGGKEGALRPRLLRARGNARSTLRGMHGAAAELIMRAIADDSREYEFNGDPLLWARGDGEPDDEAAGVELRCEHSVVLREDPGMVSMRAEKQVRVVLDLPRGGRLRLNGDEVHLAVDMAGALPAGERHRARGDSLVARVRPDALRSFSCSGRGGLPLADATLAGGARIALTAEQILGRRDENGAFLVEIEGREVRADLDLPGAMLARAMPGDSPRVADEPATYRIATRGSALIWASALNFSKDETAPDEIRAGFLTNAPATLEELPHVSRVRSLIEAGSLRLDAVLRRAGGSNADTMSAQMHAMPGSDGRVRVVAGYDILEGSFLSVALDPEALRSTFGAPVTGVLRSRSLLDAFNRQAGLYGALFGGEIPGMDAASLHCEGSLVQSVTRPGRDAPDGERAFELSLNGPFTLDGRDILLPPRLTGADARREWANSGAGESPMVLRAAGQSLTWRLARERSGESRPDSGSTYRLEIAGPVTLYLPAIESDLVCSHLVATGLADSLWLSLGGPVRAITRNAGRGALVSLAARGANAGAAAGIFEGGVRVESSGAVEARIGKGYSLRARGTFEFAALDSDDRISGRELRLDARPPADGDGSGPLAGFETFEVEGPITLRVAGNALAGSKLTFDRERSAILFDGKPMEILFAGQGSVSGIQRVEIGPRPDLPSNAALPAKPSQQPAALALRAEGQTITLRLALKKKD